MNESQRKFLIEKVNNAERKKLQEMDDVKPKEPNLNNYIVAAFLDNSIQIRTPEEIKEDVKARVLQLGPGETFVDGRRNRDVWGRRSNIQDGMIELPAEVLFDIPQNYRDAHAEYKEKYARWKEERDKVISTTETLVMKIQLGSNQVLDKLIAQADDLAEISLISSTLKLITAQQ